MMKSSLILNNWAVTSSEGVQKSEKLVENQFSFNMVKFKNGATTDVMIYMTTTTIGKDVYLLKIPHYQGMVNETIWLHYFTVTDKSNPSTNQTKGQTSGWRH